MTGAVVVIGMVVGEVAAVALGLWLGLRIATRRSRAGVKSDPTYVIDLDRNVWAVVDDPDHLGRHCVSRVEAERPSP